jgi:hypothetical protein
MSTITKEWLQQKIADMEATREEIPFGLDEDDSNTLAALRIALASLEAEAVAMRWRYLPDGIHGMGEWNYRDQGYIDTLNAYHLSRQKELLYTAPPAPLSVPDELTREEYKRRFMEDDDFDDTFRGGWNACRAAMLQGAGGNSPANPDGWKLVPNEPTTKQWAAGMQAFEYGMDKVTRVYKAMIAAAPLQEVK